MTSRNEAGKDPAKADAHRHPFGPRPLGALLPSVTRAAFRKQSPAAAQLLTDWPMIVGQALSASTVPRRLTAGTLTLACAGPVALELQHLTAQLLERINSHLGRTVVARLRFVQDTALAPPAPRPIARPHGKPVEITGLPDGPLRDALSRLGAAIRADPA